MNTKCIKLLYDDDSDDHEDKLMLTISVSSSSHIRQTDIKLMNKRTYEIERQTDVDQTSKFQPNNNMHITNSDSVNS